MEGRERNKKLEEKRKIVYYIYNLLCYSQFHRNEEEENYKCKTRKDKTE